jgi:hypothetical protein
MEAREQTECLGAREMEMGRGSSSRRYDVGPRCDQYRSSPLVRHSASSSACGVVLVAAVVGGAQAVFFLPRNCDA